MDNELKERIGWIYENVFLYDKSNKRKLSLLKETEGTFLREGMILTYRWCGTTRKLPRCEKREI